MTDTFCLHESVLWDAIGTSLYISGSWHLWSSGSQHGLSDPHIGARKLAMNLKLFIWNVLSLHFAWNENIICAEVGLRFWFDTSNGPQEKKKIENHWSKAINQIECLHLISSITMEQMLTKCCFFSQPHASIISSDCVNPQHTVLLLMHKKYGCYRFLEKFWSNFTTLLVVSWWWNS